jgi:hypothetical protein
MFLKRFGFLCLVVHLVGAGSLASGANDPRPVWVLSNGFHSAFAFRTESAPPSVRAVGRKRKAGWMMVGWGDKQFFMAKKGNPWVTIQAVCWPTPSALHLIPLPSPPERLLRNTEIVRLELPAKQFAALSAYIEAAFARAPNGKTIELGPGFSEGSVFFLGSEKFYFPKMCNWWVAAGVRQAGLPVHPVCALTAHELMRQLRKHGRRVGGLRLPVDSF